VGNVISINFWLDNWCANDSLASLLNMTNNSLTDSSLKLSHFIIGNKEWDATKLHSIVGPAYIQLILAIPFPFNTISNSVCWGLSGNVEFSTKSTTWAAHGLNYENLLV